MAYRKNYSNSEYEKFLKQDFSSNFGISKDKMASAYSTSAVANRYGLSKAWIKGTMIPYLEDKLGGYATFMLKSMVEGGGACNYLNHYSPTGQAGCSNDKMQALKIDVGMVQATLKKNTPGPNGSDTGQPSKPAMSSYESNYVTWPEDKPGEAKKMWDNMPKGSIGAHYMQSTHAGNGWVFQHSSAMSNWQGQLYDVGNAYDQMIDLIEYYGGKPFDGKKASNDSNDDGGSSSGSDLSDLLSGLGREGQKLLEGLFEKIEDMLTYDLHSIGTDMFFSNKYFKLFKTYNNTYRIQINVPFFDELKGLIGDLPFDKDDDKGSDGSDGSNGSNGSNGKYNTSYITSHHRNFRYGKTVAETQANGYPFAGKAHHGNDYNFVYEELKSPISGTVDGNNGHGFTVNDGGIGYDGDGTGWGNRIVIKLDDGSGRSMLFGHLSKMNVKAGDKVKVGQVIGVTGNTGEMTTGPHLHVELVDPNHSNRASDRTIDPTPFLEKYS